MIDDDRNRRIEAACKASLARDPAGTAAFRSGFVEGAEYESRHLADKLDKLELARTRVEYLEVALDEAASKIGEEDYIGALVECTSALEDKVDLS